MRPVVVLSAIAASLFLSVGGPAQAAQGTADRGDHAAPITFPITFPWTARGNEPGWVLTLDAGQMLYRTADGALRIEAALPQPEFRDDTWIYRASPADLTVSLQRKICRDTMTGMPSPISASVETGGKTVTGCGGTPSDLLGGGEWQIIAIGDQEVPDGVKVSLTFDAAAGHVSGSSGCNRYFGAFKLSGEGLSFAQGMAGSMMACEDIPARIEQAFLSAMAKVQRFDISSDGSLLLITADGVILKSKARPQK